MTDTQKRRQTLSRRQTRRQACRQTDTHRLEEERGAENEKDFGNWV